ncbi:MAG: ANTAR domain-containing protein [Oscillospiraceae bacterium]|nr:ANTAR domain-containing protein [Oscillospiraceae bacterium]
MSEKQSIIIFSAAGETLDNITLTAKEYGFNDISVSGGDGARDLLVQNSYDLVFVNTPLENEFGLDLAAAARKQGCGVIISAASKLCRDISEKIGDMDIFVLPRPLNKQLLLQTFRFVLTAREKEQELLDKNVELEKRLQDTKLVDRAKCVLVEYLRISEQDAHRQIQKQAMDMRIPLVAAAREILKTYEM